MNTRNVIVVSVSLVFLVVSVALVLLSSTNTEQPQETTHTATVNGLDVTYYVVSEVDSEEGFTNEYDPGTEMCNIRLSRDYMEGTPPAVFGILGSLANCYGQAELGFPTGDFAADVNYVNRFIREYIDRCDRRLEPLGFPVNDGQCDDMPRFEEVL